ncbi:MAG: hypothetical protein ACPHID_04080 [Thermoplasmatota archaeon]
MRDEPTAADITKEAAKAFRQLGADFREAFEKHAEGFQYELDKKIGQQLAKHPELYAELKRGYRSVRRGMDKLAGDLGLK